MCPPMPRPSSDASIVERERKITHLCQKPEVPPHSAAAAVTIMAVRAYVARAYFRLARIYSIHPLTHSTALKCSKKTIGRMLEPFLAGAKDYRAHKGRKPISKGAPRSEYPSFQPSNLQATIRPLRSLCRKNNASNS